VLTRASNKMRRILNKNLVEDQPAFGAASLDSLPANRRGGRRVRHFVMMPEFKK